MLLKQVITLLLIFALLSISGCITTPKESGTLTATVSANMTKPPPFPYPTDPLTSTVLRADLIALGTITDQRNEVVIKGTENSTEILLGDNISSANYTGKFAYTIFTLSVEKVMKGDPATKEVLIKVEGGYIGDLYQVPTGGYFRISDQVLVGLIRKEDNIYTLFYQLLQEGSPFPIEGKNSVLWIKSSIIMPTTSLQEMMGRVAKIMIALDIPIALDEPIPIPVGPIKGPKEITQSVPEPTKNSP